MAWSPDIETIQLYYAVGAGNMGDVTTDTEQKTRFTDTSGAARFVPVFVRCHFFGGSGTATMAMKLRAFASRAYYTPGTESTGGMYDTYLKKFLAVGQGSDLYWRVQERDFESWIFEKGDEFVFEWTDPGTTDWGMTVALAPVPGVAA